VMRCQRNREGRDHERHDRRSMRPCVSSYELHNQAKRGNIVRAARLHVNVYMAGFSSL
jgi:hypothetical protein